MGVQSNILNQYRALQSANNVPKFVNPVNTRVDNMSFVDFIFELLKITKGRSGFDNIVLKGVLTDLKSTIDIDSEIKKIIKEFLMCNTSMKITQEMTTESVGVDIVIPEIDPFGLLTVDPNSKMGKYYYEGNDDVKDINYIFYKALTATKKAPFEYKKNNSVIFSAYSPSANILNFSFGTAYKDKYFYEWVDDYLADIKFFNIPNFFSMLTDIVSGGVSIKSNKSENQIQKEVKLITALKKIFGYCSDDNGNAEDPKSDIPNDIQGSPFDITGDKFNRDLEKNGNDDQNPFDFTANELYDIASEASRLYNNLIRFETCGNLMVPINPDELLAALDNLFNGNETGANNSDGAAIFDNENIEPNADAIKLALDSILSSGVQEVINEGEDDLVINLPNIKLEFELNLLKQIPYAMMKCIITPKLLVLFKTGGVILDSARASFESALTEDANVGLNYISVPTDKLINFKAGDKIQFLTDSLQKQIYTVFEVTDDKIYLTRVITKKIPIGTKILNLTLSNISINGEDVIVKLKDVLKQIGSVTVNKILKNIYEMIKAELTKLFVEMLKKALMQRLRDYVAVLESLLALLNLLKNLKIEKCSSMLSQILSLLQIPIPMPAIPIPPMLTLLAGGLKPGMNEVVAINQMKTQLQKYGINTSQVNSDGSPNAYILGLEAVMSTMITHIKVNSNIQTEVMTAVGPGKGFSQIQ